MQEKFLDIRVFDEVTKDLIGLVHIDLSPLLLPTKSPQNATFNGWHPIYSTTSGILGELEIEV